MKVNAFSNQKRSYCYPIIEVVQLDNEISLTLLSDIQPTLEPDWLSTAPMMDSSPIGL